MRFVLLLIAAIGVLYWQHPEVMRHAGRMTGLLEPLPAGSGLQLFVLDNCGICDQEADLLTARGVAFDRIVVRNDSGDAALARFQDAGGTGRFPLLVAGDQRYEGFQKQAVIGFVAQLRGPSVLTPVERAIMAHNFDAAGRPRVVMYSTATCGYCRAARSWLAARNIPWVERDVEADRFAAADFRALEAGGTPLIFIGYRRVDGFNQPVLEEAVAAL